MVPFFVDNLRPFFEMVPFFVGDFQAFSEMVPFFVDDFWPYFEMVPIFIEDFRPFSGKLNPHKPPSGYRKRQMGVKFLGVYGGLWGLAPPNSIK